MKAKKRKSWEDSVMDLIASLEPGTLFTSDKIRVMAVKAGCTRPAHPNKWGGAISTARHKKLIAKTGRYVPSLIPSNHGAVIAEWRRI